jgi:hypothetical protein
VFTYLKIVLKLIYSFPLNLDEFLANKIIQEDALPSASESKVPKVRKIRVCGGENARGWVFAIIT